MKIVNERARIREVAAAWAEQYRAYGPETRFGNIERRLALLDPEKATAAEVKAIIGNDSWTRIPDCFACGGHLFDFVVEIPKVQETGEFDAVRLCPRCVGLAYAKAGEFGVEAYEAATLGSPEGGA